MVLIEPDQLFQQFSDLKLPNFEQLQDNLWPAESGREKELCGMNSRDVGFAFTTLQMFCVSLLGLTARVSGQCFPESRWGCSCRNILQKITRDRGKLEGRMANNCIRITWCWIELSPAKPDRRWVEEVKFKETYGKLCRDFFFQHASEK